MEIKSSELVRYAAPAAAILAGVAALTGCGETHQTAPTTTTTPKPIFAPNILHNGESVSLEGLHVRINHNSIIIGQTAMTAFRNAHPKAELQITMTTDNGAKREFMVTDQAGGGSNIEEDEMGNDILECFPVEGPDCKVTVNRGIARFGGPDRGTLEPLNPQNATTFWLRPLSVV